MTYAVIVIVVCVFAWVVIRRHRLTYLLEASITAQDGVDYTVSFRSLHPETKPIEYVWLDVLLATKLLYIIGDDTKQEDARSRLLSLIATIGATSLTKIDDLVAVTGDPIDVRIGESSNGKTITAKVGFVDQFKRIIWTYIPITWFQYQFPHSFLAVIQASLPRLDTMHRERLQGSLARLAELYLEEGWDTSSLKSLQNAAFFSFNDAKDVSAKQDAGLLPKS